MRGFEYVKQSFSRNYTIQKVNAGDFISDFDGEVIEVKDFAVFDLPSRATYQSAGYDFQSPISFTLHTNEVITIWTDVRCKMLPDEFLSIHIRSSLGKKGLQLMNQVGIIDSDYYGNTSTGGNIGVVLTNTGSEPITINAKEYFIQGIFRKYMVTANDLPRNVKRNGGFGSSGK